MKLIRPLGVGGLVVLSLVAMQLASVAALQAQETTDIYVLGRPSSTFSPHSPRDLDELKDLFDRFEADLRKVLEISGWQGNPDDLFTAVRSAKEGDGTVTRRSVQQGETLQWMAYRRGGDPAIIKNPRWAAKKPYEAWQIKVDSEGTTSTFVVPLNCMNLALDKVEDMSKMQCSLSATFDAPSDTITVTGRTDAKSFEITSFQVPGGEGNMNDLESAGDLKWTYQPSSDGLHRFNATAGTGKRASTCSAEVNVTREKAACAIDVTVDPETYVMTVEATGVKGEFEFAGLTLPDGSTAGEDAFESAGERRWTFDASDSLPKKPGDYTYRFNGSAAHRGSDATCDKVVVVTREAPDYRWIVRGYGAYINPTGSRAVETQPNAIPVENPAFADGTQITQAWAKDGFGFGADIEYMVNPNVGIFGSILLGEIETHFMYDNPENWLMGDQDSDFNMFSAGVNYHFTPTSRVDFFAGGFVGLIQYDDVTFSTEIGQDFRFDFDDDVGFGLQAGVDVPFKEGGPWIFTAGLKYVFTGADDQNSNVDPDIDPWIGTIGIGYRF